MKSTRTDEIPIARIVVTGGPGAGKSTLIDALAQRGFPHMPEAGRSIIRDQMTIGGTALPWKDREAFAALMLAFDIRSWREAGRIAGPVFFDRGIVDVIGYLTLEALPVPDALYRAADTWRYADRVFVAPHWPEIYAQDDERRQDAAKAQATHEAMLDAYRSQGYDPVELPRSSVAARCDFVIEALGALETTT